MIPSDASPAPPDSIFDTPKVFSSGSPRQMHTVTALPGTMSSRSQTTSRSRTRASRYQTMPKTATATPRPFSKRCKSASQKLFRRDAVDALQYEYLSDRHWTNE
ncbi:hypothetical protein LTR17_027840 [Elasticomyces elasticus]|nr:hypothetical protein LTR17_027840 [Elasticomyces elasticus]